MLQHESIRSIAKPNLQNPVIPASWCPGGVVSWPSCAVDEEGSCTSQLHVFHTMKTLIVVKYDVRQRDITLQMNISLHIFAFNKNDIMGSQSCTEAVFLLYSFDFFLYFPTFFKNRTVPKSFSELFH